MCLCWLVSSDSPLAAIATGCERGERTSSCRDSESGDDCRGERTRKRPSKLGWRLCERDGGGRGLGIKRITDSVQPRVHAATLLARKRGAQILSQAALRIRSADSKRRQTARRLQPP